MENKPKYNINDSVVKYYSALNNISEPLTIVRILDVNNSYHYKCINDRDYVFYYNEDEIKYFYVVAELGNSFKNNDIGF